MDQNIYKKPLIWLLVISTIFRSILAFFTEFGNDEVYYTLYSAFPDWSHFDHPPMVGWFIQLTSFDGLIHNELFVRLGGILSCAVATITMYKLATLLANERTGWYAALIFTASIYASLISGVFILPDSPQLLFWLAALYFFAKAFRRPRFTKTENRAMLFAGVAVGLALLSKYTSIFIWLGAVLYIIGYQRDWLKNRYFYFSALISFLLFLPVLIWNFQNDFISFGFHTERVEVQETSIQWMFFAKEILGEIVYNNPIVWLLVMFSMVLAFTRSWCGEKLVRRYLLLTGVPMILIFWGFSLFRSTLPHWTGPAYVTLIPLAAVWLDYIQRKDGTNRLIPIWVFAALILLVVGTIVAELQIHTGIIKLDNHEKIYNKGEDDFSLDMYGWNQLGEKFEKLEKSEVEKNLISPDARILSFRWFPAANLEYYVANRLDKDVLAIGALERIHKYAWINEEVGGFHLGDDFWFITSSRDYVNPNKLYKDYFTTIETADTIPIERGGETVMYQTVYRLKGLKKLPENPLGVFVE